jgi:2-succinyl-6-hydroxy-2,4-cyclohexadiene-1-carboxylate synthase
MPVSQPSELLPVRLAGPPDGRPVILLHGFLADSRQWQPLTTRVDALLTRPVRWLLLDLPGHGTAQFPTQPGWPALVDLLARSLRPHLTQPALLGGYSMGGRMAAALAAAHELELAGLWLESAHPPLAEDAAVARRQDDEARALRLERDGLAAFVDTWEELPLFASQKRLPPDVRAAQRRVRMGQNPTALAQNLRWYGTGTMPADLHIAVPTRMLVGALDPGLLARMAQWHEHAANLRVATTPDAGHAVHLEQPDAVAQHLAQAITAAFR